MCDEEAENLHPRVLKKGLCAKCKEASPSISVRNIEYCQGCFINATIHRFRTNFLKIKTPKEPKVLLAVSGGPSSTCLLELFTPFAKGDSNPNRPLQFPSVVVCHVNQSVLLSESNNLKDQISILAESYGFPFVSFDLETLFESGQYSSLHSNVMLVESIDSLKSNKELLKKCINVDSVTAREDLFRILTMRSLVKVAKQQGCNIIILGENATLLAIRTISLTSRGRGANLSNNLGLSSIIGTGESKDSITVLRPLRDTLAKEIGLFNEFKSIKSFSNGCLTTGMDKRVSIERMTADFITNLQSELPSTVSTITKTAFKIHSNSKLIKTADVCNLCYGRIDDEIVICRPVPKLSTHCFGCRVLITECRIFPT